MPLKVHTIFNDKGERVGETDRHPATVQVEEFGNPISPQYRIIDGNGKVVPSPDEEVDNLEAEMKAMEARIEALREVTEEKREVVKTKEVVPSGKAVL